jgi:hypothetical protein
MRHLASVFVGSSLLVDILDRSTVVQEIQRIHSGQCCKCGQSSSWGTPICGPGSKCKCIELKRQCSVLCNCRAAGACDNGGPGNAGSNTIQSTGINTLTPNSTHTSSNTQSTGQTTPRHIHQVDALPRHLRDMDSDVDRNREMNTTIIS